MLQPVRTKWRKAHKGRIHGNASRANFINYGAYALKALTPDRVTGNQIIPMQPLDLDNKFFLFKASFLGLEKF